MADSDATLRTAANGAGRHSEGDRPHIDSSKLKLLSEMSQYKSNTFKLELDEMLSQVRLNQAKHFAAAEKVLHRLRTAVDNIRDRAGLTVRCGASKSSAILIVKQLEYAERDMKKRNIHIPFPNPEPTSDVKYSFSYLKPTYMNVVGSYATKTMSKNTGQLTLDLVIGMPEVQTVYRLTIISTDMSQDIFNEKDYLNYRYFHKRAYYLAAIMDGIKGDKTTQSLELAYELLNDDHLKPIIVVYPSKGMPVD